MFQFFNRRLYPDVAPRTLSFRIPDSFWIDTLTDGSATNSIMLRPRDQKSTIEVCVDMSGGRSIAEDLLYSFEGAPEKEIDGPHPITAGGIPGQCIYCFSDLPQYVILLDLSSYAFRGAFNSEDRFDRLEIIVSVGNHGNRDESIATLQDVIHSQKFEEMLDSIQVE